MFSIFSRNLVMLSLVIHMTSFAKPAGDDDLPIKSWPTDVDITKPQGPADDVPSSPPATDLDTGSGKSIKVLSYNICFECMTQDAEGTAGALGKKCIKTLKGGVSVTICAINTARNIDEINETYKGSGLKEYDFVGLQEASQWQNLQKISSALRGMKAVGARLVTSFYNKKYTLEKSFDGLLMPGRQFQILVFKEGIIFVNVHAPHPGKIKGTLSNLLTQKLSAALKAKFSAKEIEKLKAYRIIMTGDYNDHHKSLGVEQQKGKVLMPFKEAGIATEVYLNDVPEDSISSCCNTDIPHRPGRLVGDYVLDSMPRKSFKWLKFKVPSNYRKEDPASDHLPVIYEGKID